MEVGAELRDLVGDLLSQVDSESDLPSKQTVQDYTKPEGQQAYVDMYLAKYLGLWRFLRAVLPDTGANGIVSIGAGPMFCLLGWFFDRAAQPHHSITAYDPLSWDHIRDLPEWLALRERVLGGAGSLSFGSGIFIPGPFLPPQLAEFTEAKYLPAEQIPMGAEVFVPFVLNHLVGSEQSVADPEPIVTWLNRVRERASRVIVVDIPIRDYKPPFWSWFGPMIKARNEPKNLWFNDGCRDFVPAFEDEDHGRRRCGVKYPQFATAVCMIGDSTGWWFHHS